MHLRVNKENIMNKFITIPIITSLLLAGCGPAPKPTSKDIQARKAQEAANQIQFDENAEIDNIKHRLELTSNPGQIGFVLLLNEMGKPVMYASVKGKITSGGKRLTAPQEVRCLDMGGGGCTQSMVEAPSDEGTYGSSAPYIFFFDINGQYYQWSGNYLYSDKPFRINDKPLVLNVVTK